MVDGLQSALGSHLIACSRKSAFWVCGGTGGRTKLRPLTELVSVSPSKLKLIKWRQLSEQVGFGFGRSLFGVGSSKRIWCMLRWRAGQF